MKQEIIQLINRQAIEGEPFLFVINYPGDRAYVKKLSEIDPGECLYDLDGKTNSKGLVPNDLPHKIGWDVKAPSLSDYEKSFDIVKRNILAGNSYLANLTCQVPIECNLSLEDIFFHSRGRYKLLMNKDADGFLPFVCFSPETFVKIRNGRIYSYPMKGTLDASLPHAEKRLMEDEKEAAEHATIVDLIRNDLSRVASDVRVDRYRYMDVLHTNKGDILQTSSEISGKLPADYEEHLGDILAAQLPAGSITGAPKDKTCSIIHEAETYDRGFYTGIMGIYEHGELDSAVMIRFIEQTEQGMVFKAGGGITSKSLCQREYEEVLQKVYLPMSQQFVETIKIKGGKVINLPYHQARMERTLLACFPSFPRKNLPQLEKILSPTSDMDFYKARVVYGGHGIEDIQYAPYTMREIHTLKIITDNDIDYTFKSTDRSKLNRLVAQKGDCDDIVIIKNGLVTDTSFTNIAAYIDGEWLTPRHPLLMGTKRASLLAQGILREADITLEDLMKAERISLINAMIELGEVQVLPPLSTKL